MTRLIIIGAGDLAQEIYSWLHEASNITWSSVGFLDGSPQNCKLLLGEGIVGTIDTYIPKPTDIFACGISDTKLKSKVYNTYKKRNAIFVNIIHKTSIIAKDSSLGKGLILFPYTYVSKQAKISNFVCLNSFTSIGHDAVIGPYSTLSSHCDVTGHVILQTGVFMGTHASIIPQKKIGNFSILGAGAVVMRNVPDHVTMIGNPAHILIHHTKDKVLDEK